MKIRTLLVMALACLLAAGSVFAASFQDRYLRDLDRADTMAELTKEMDDILDDFEQNKPLVSYEQFSKFEQLQMYFEFVRVRQLRILSLQMDALIEKTDAGLPTR